MEEFTGRMVFILRESDVKALITMEDTIEAVQKLFLLQAQGKVVMPPRLQMTVKGLSGPLRAMLAAIPDLGAVGLKTISGAPGFRSPEGTYFTILLYDAEDGRLSAIMSGDTITQYRTGAASAVATKYLAKEDSRGLGLLGTGVQGRMQVMAISKVRKLESVKVFDTVGTKAQELSQELEKVFGLRAKAVRSPGEVLDGTDILVTATPSKTPILDGALIKEGTHINAIGSNTPDKCELDGIAFKRSKVFLDSKEQALLEAGDLMKAISANQIRRDSLHELAEVISGKLAGRKDQREITMFKSVGVAIEDVVVASVLYNLAKERGVGVESNLK